MVGEVGLAASAGTAAGLAVSGNNRLEFYTDTSQLHQSVDHRSKNFQFNISDKAVTLKPNHAW